jgi:tetratricopeptide (TPR) repeat protein
VWAIVGLVVVAGGAILWWRLGNPWQRDAQPPRTATDQDAEEDEPAVADPGYLGPQSCAACHARRVAEFQATSHFRACRLPLAETMPPGFAPGRGTYVARQPGLRFEMTRDGGDFLQTAIHTTPGGEQRTTSRLGLVYGTGTADEIYFTWKDDRLYELPVAWLHPLKRWAEQPFNPYATGDFSRSTTTRCLECHNTWFEHIPGTPNQYRREHVILGVTCERCHGAGREHVAFHQAHPEADSAHAVVHPGRLTRDRQMDLCAQCHSNAPKPRGPAFSYRPGEPLEAHFRTNLNTRPEADHVANQVYYLRQSKCFQKSDTLTCTTCHNPHRPGNSASVQGSCLKCHQSAHCPEQDRLPAAVRGDCVGCHMPRFTRIQVFFHTEDDQYVAPMRPHQHRIAVYPAARQEVLLAWYRTQSDAAGRQEAGRLTAALVGHWLTEAENYRREYRFLAAVGALREAVRIDPTPATRARLQEFVAVQAKLDADMFTAQHLIDERHFPEAIETLEKSLRVKPDWAKGHGKLGMVYAITGQEQQAAEHLEAVARCDPDDASGHAMLGWLAYLRDDAEEAVAAYRRADEIEPWNAKTNYHLGLALTRLDRFSEAVARFRQALAIEPRHAGACQGLSNALREQGESAEALRFARRAARLTDYQNADILLTLVEAYADTGRFGEARDTAARALAVARTSDPKLEPQIRRRLEELRQRTR